MSVYIHNPRCYIVYTDTYIHIYIYIDIQYTCVYIYRPSSLTGDQTLRRLARDRLGLEPPAENPFQEKSREYTVVVVVIVKRPSMPCWETLAPPLRCAVWHIAQFFPSLCYSRSSLLFVPVTVVAACRRGRQPTGPCDTGHRGRVCVWRVYATRCGVCGAISHFSFYDCHCHCGRVAGAAGFFYTTLARCCTARRASERRVDADVAYRRDYSCSTVNCLVFG